MNSTLPQPIDYSVSALTGKNILVIDDDPSMLTAVSKVLTRGGAHVKAAGATAEAMALLAERHASFDAVVTDLRMPVASGKLILSTIKTMAPTMPVLIMSAYWTPEMKEECAQLGVAECLDKPLNAMRLLGAVARAILRPDAAD